MTESFFHYPNNKYVLLALLGATAGQGVVWYTGQFYALFFLVITLRVDYMATAYELIGLSLIIGTPFFIVFGWLSDRIGRLKIILAGCAIAAITYFPLFQGLTHYTNPDLEAFAAKNPISVSADQSTCNLHVFVGPWSKFSDCDRAQDFLTKSGLSFQTIHTPGAKSADLDIAGTKVAGWNATTWQAALTAKNFPKSADPAKINWFMTEVILVIMVIYVTMVYGPIAGLPGRNVPDQDPLYLDVVALSHRQWLVRRDVAAAGDRGGRRDRQCQRSVVSDRSSGDDLVIGLVFLRDTRGLDIRTGSGVAIQKG